MNPELIPMLLLSLLLMASDGAGAGTARIVLSGEHRIDDTREPLIVGDATVTIPASATRTAPVYLIGGTTRITGTVHDRVTQIAGTLLVDGDAEIDRLHVIAGVRRIAPTADIARRTGVDLTPRERHPVAIVVPLLLAAGALAFVGARLARTRQRNLDNITGALSDHPIVTLTVGLLLVLTALSLFVFMAFTLVLIPVSVLGLMAGIAATALGIVGWGHRVGRRLPLRQPRAATAAGVAAVTVGLQFVGAVPLVGDVVVGFVVLSGLGAVAITYVGFATFRPAPLPD
jgi:hypothetical protein